jgi:hypothetical protein
MNRLLSEARGSFLRDGSGERTEFVSKYALAVDSLRTELVQNVEKGVEETAKRMLGFTGSRAASGLSLKFSFADPANPHSSLRLMCEQDGLLLEDVPTGVEFR